MIFGAMTESFCAEQSARMTAMDSATKSANDMIRDLQLEYNRTRQGLSLIHISARYYAPVLFVLK